MKSYKPFIIFISVLVAITSVFGQNDSDNSFVFDNFDRNYDSLLSQYYMKRNKKATNHRFGNISVPSSVVVSAANTSDSVFAHRLDLLPTRIPMTYNKHVRNQIVYYIDRIGDKVETMLGLSKYYFPIFEGILDKYDMPLELRNLAVIESALNASAVSRVGATGLWQFMYSTARLYNLDINSLVDERKDPVKSTEAAARYLRDLYNIYHDWSLALAAYNCGPGNVNKAIRRSGGKQSFWEIYPFLPRETRGYVPAFIAANYVMNYYSHHGLSPLNLTPLPPTDTIMVNKDLHFAQIASVLEIELDLLENMNPQYKTSVIPGKAKPCCLKLPVEKMGNYIAMEDSVFNHRRYQYFDSLTFAPFSSLSKVCHKVQKGETWKSIATLYNVSEEELKDWNKTENNILQEDKTIILFQKNNNKTITSDKQSKRITHKVKKGDTVSKLSKKYGVPASSIIRLNRLNKRNPVIYAGKTLIIKE